jgi:hypothetical protein
VDQVSPDESGPPVSHHLLTAVIAAPSFLIAPSGVVPTWERLSEAGPVPPLLLDLFHAHTLLLI